MQIVHATIYLIGVLTICQFVGYKIADVVLYFAVKASLARLSQD
jgi:hypothetical protein